MKKRKILCLIMAFTVVISTLSACDSGKNTTTEADDTTANISTVSDVSSVQNSLSEENNSSENVSSVQTTSSEISSESSSETSSKVTSETESTEPEKDEEKEQPKEDENDSEPKVDPPERDESKSETEQWYLVLANPDNSLTKEYIAGVKKATINKSYTTYNESSKYLDSRIVDIFVTMCKDAKKDGIKLYAVSAYRTYEHQENLFKKRVQRVIREEGLPEDEATEKAATIVARPGTSEHHLGLAVDINSVETSFEKTKAFKWLQENAENYGFVMRYPKDKKSITKIIYEPWHYRYVGVEHAKEMNRLDMCLEEYLDYLNAQNSQNNETEN